MSHPTAIKYLFQSFSSVTTFTRSNTCDPIKEAYRLALLEAFNIIHFASRTKLALWNWSRYRIVLVYRVGRNSRGDVKDLEHALGEKLMETFENITTSYPRYSYPALSASDKVRLFLLPLI